MCLYTSSMNVSTFDSKWKTKYLCIKTDITGGYYLVKKRIAPTKKHK